MTILIGVIAGIVTGLGAGGGTVLISGLSLLLGIEQRVAQSINLIFFIPTALTSIILNSKNKNIKWKIAIPVIIASIIGSIIGAKISTNIGTDVLKKMFGVFLGLIALYGFYSIWKDKYTK